MNRSMSILAGSLLTVSLTMSASPVEALQDPFGPVGNRSLVLDNFNGGATVPSNLWPFAWWNLGGDYSSAEIEFDLYMENDPSKFWTYVDLRIGSTAGGIPSGVTADTAIYDNYRVQGGSGAFYFENASAPANGHPFTPETAHHVKYTIDGNARTYTIQVTPSGGFVERVAGNPNNTWRVPFVLAGNTTFNVLAIGGAFGPTTLASAPFYIDNLLITSGGQTILDEDFDDDAVGGLPNTGNYIGQDTVGSDVEVVEFVPEPASWTTLVLIIACAGMVIRRHS